MTRREELAWAGGLFEGEGSITRCRTKPKLQIQMTDEDPLVRFYRTVSLGRLSGPYLPPSRVAGGYKPIWNWSAHNFEAVQAVLAILWPWLGERRRERAHEVLLGYRNNGCVKRIRKTVQNIPEGDYTLTKADRAVINA